MDNDYTKAANITVIIAGILLFSWFFFKYALGALVPFILAAAIAALVTPLSDKISKKLKTPKKLTAAAVSILFFTLLASVVYFAAHRLINEAMALFDKLSAEPEIISGILDDITQKISSFGSRFGFLNQLSESEEIEKLGLDLDRLLSQAIQSLMGTITSIIPSAAVGLFVKIPELLLFLAVLIISSFYFCADRDVISAALSSILPDKWRERLPSFKEKISRSLRGYIKAYLLIMLLTFCEVYLGLSILGVDYAFIISITVALVDILPILGAGTVLVPWSVVSLLISNYKLGIGLLIIYAIITVIRQIAEPKIVGSSLGLHPLATLASIYISIKFIGFLGIFIGPVIALLICSFFKSDDETEEAPTSVKKRNSDSSEA